MKTTLYLVRHGETEWNIKNIIQGQSDSELSEEGLKAAKNSTGLIESIKPDVIYSSDLGRALKTAEIIINGNDYKIIKDKGLRELSFGKFEGYSWEQLKGMYPEETLGYERNIDGTCMPPEGESWVQFRERILDAIEILVRENSGKNILVITHGGFIRTFLRHLKNIPPGQRSEFKIDNLSLTVIEHNESGYQIKKEGSTGHIRN